MKAFPTLALIYAPLFALLGLWIWLRGGTCDGDGTARLETYWEPEFVLAATEPAQDRLIGKLGGLPWGFPASRWPVCGECDHALSHIAQLPHVPQVFELGKRGRVLHLFHCEVDGSCSTWDDSTGAGAWVLLGKTELGKGLTRPPEGTEVLGEYWIKGWDKRTTPRAIIQNLDAWNDYRRFFTLDDDITDEAFAVRHKAGGVPYWTGNGPGGHPSAPFEYLAQFGTFVHCAADPPTPDEAGTSVRTNYRKEAGGHVYAKPNEGSKGEARHLLQVEPDGDGFYGDWANLGSDGTGFLFIDRQVDPVQVVWFWNR